MATARLSSIADDWRYANPWLWIAVGLIAGLSALGLAQLTGQGTEVPRLLLISGSMLAAGAAVAVRLTSTAEPFLERLPWPRRQVLMIVASLLAIIPVVVLVVLFLAIDNRDVPWSVETMFLILFVSAPISAAVIIKLINCAAAERHMSDRLESAALLVFAAFCAFLCGWALYRNEFYEREWYSMRIFLATLSFAGFAAAVLALLSSAARRVVVSLMILLHFATITTAILGIQPAPWLLSQVRMRFFRNYMQFMFLENAYQFYAPNPGPSNYLWFYIQYENSKEPGVTKSSWHKFPDMTADGAPNYPLAIQFHRRVAMADQMAITSGAAPSVMIELRDDQGNIVKSRMNDVWYWRYHVSNIHRQLFARTRKILDEKLEADLLERYTHSGIPFHPSPLKPFAAQYREPAPNAQRLIESTVRNLVANIERESPNIKVLSVRTYHVVHEWPTPELIINGISPRHPALYYPHYQGKYSREGKLLDAPEFDIEGNLISGDPMLHWMVPILPVDLNKHENVLLKGWVFKHAGDENWLRDYPKEASWHSKRQMWPK